MKDDYSYWSENLHSAYLFYTLEVDKLNKENQRLREALEEIKSSLEREKTISDEGYEIDMKNWLIDWYNETKRTVNTVLKSKH